MQQLGSGSPSVLQKPAAVKPGHRSHRSDGQRVVNLLALGKIPIWKDDAVDWSLKGSLVHEGLNVHAIGTGLGPNLVQAVGLDEAAAKEKQKLRLEKGLTLDLLREHLPKYFREPGPMDIYAENILFVDDISPHIGLQPFNIEGKENYASMLWNLRFHTSLFCRDVEVDILRFWQPDPDHVMARWEITLYPRLLNGVYGTKMKFDGISEFSLNRAGKICQHRVDILNTDGLRSSLGLHYLLNRNPMCPLPTC